MTFKSGLTAIAALFALAGCVVQPVDGTYVSPQGETVYQSPPAQQSFRIGGPWQIIEDGKVARRITVERTRGGIVVNRPRRQDFAQRVDRGLFQDEDGNLYRFFSNVEGQFEIPRRGRLFRLVRP